MISSSRIFARISGGAAGRLALVVLALGGLALHLVAGAEFAFAATAKRFPEPTGYVNDFAGIVDPASADSIVSLATELQEKTGAELAVVTLADLGGDAIDPAATALFREWGIGRTGHDDGVLVLLALAERKVRIEPGYGLEGPLPDGRCGSIVRRVMGPDLSAGHYGAGLLAGARAVAGAIAADKGVAITGSIPPRAIGAASGKEAPAWVLLVVFVMMVLFFSMITRAASRFGGHGTYRDWRMGRRGSNDPWGGFGGGWGGMGGFGGGGGGGGGFGGFGGGRSGGGGASGGF